MRKFQNIVFVAVIVLVSTLFITASQSRIMHTPGTVFSLSGDAETAIAVINSGNDVVYLRKDNNGNSYFTKYNIANDSSSQLGTDDVDYRPDTGNQILANDQYIVWTDARNNANDDLDCDIYCINISTNTESRVTNVIETRSSLSLLGTYIVYVENNSSNPGIYVKDLSTAATPSLIASFSTASAAKLSTSSVLGSGYVCYEWKNGSTYDLRLYNIITQSTTTIASSVDALEYDPVFCAQKIFYVSQSGTLSSGEDLPDIIGASNGSIKSYDISTQSTSTITTFSSDQNITLLTNPQSSYLVYQKYCTTLNGMPFSYLMLVNPVNNSITTIASGNQIDADAQCAYGNKVVYSKIAGFANFDTYIYDITTNTSSAITTSSLFSSGRAVIQNSTVAFFENDVPTSQDEDCLYCGSYARAYLIP